MRVTVDRDVLLFAYNQMHNDSFSFTNEQDEKNKKALEAVLFCDHAWVNVGHSCGSRCTKCGAVDDTY